jgi:SAM-dependent methyltransferase
VSEKKWEKYAKEDALFYIWPPYAGDESYFWEGGKRDAAEIFKEVQDLISGSSTAIEIGCGVGRLLIPMCSHFQRCIGVDIARPMLDKLLESAERFGVRQQVAAFHVSEPWHRESADFVYSFLVLQHIADWRVIVDYVQRISACLREQGVAFLQFDTRPATVSYRLRNLLPDVLLPRVWKTGVRRIRRKRPPIVDTLSKSSLSVVKEIGAGTDRHIFVVKKAASLLPQAQKPGAPAA